MNEFNAIYKEFSEETHCYHYIIRKVSVCCALSKWHFWYFLLITVELTAVKALSSLRLWLMMYE